MACASGAYATTPPHTAEAATAAATAAPATPRRRGASSDVGDKGHLLKALLTFSQSNFEIGCCLQSRVELAHRPAAVRLLQKSGGGRGGGLDAGSVTLGGGGAVDDGARCYGEADSNHLMLCLFYPSWCSWRWMRTSLKICSRCSLCEISKTGRCFFSFLAATNFETRLAGVNLEAEVCCCCVRLGDISRVARG